MVLISSSSALLGESSSSSSSSSSAKHPKVGLPKRFRLPLFYMAAFGVLSFVLFYQINLGPAVWSIGCPDRQFIEAISKRATPDRFIVLALVDAAFAEMAINLYEASLRPNKIENFLFVGAGRRACTILWNASLPCYHYAEDADSEVASVYLSRDFVRKMNIRTDMVLDALYSGFTVLHTDLDVALLRNPLPDIKDVLLSADLAALWDSVAFNAGFVAVRPTVFGIKVYELMKKITSRYHKIDDQKAMTMAISRMRRLHGKAGFRAATLDRKRYLCGYDYFEKGGRWFPVGGGQSDCEECSVVHNNWIVSREAKIYRFKEHLMWMQDRDGYYSNLSGRYIIYSNPIPFLPAPSASPGVTVEWPRLDSGSELASLGIALIIGMLLDRVVILPRFHCLNGGGSGPRSIRDCPLNSLLNISAFEASFAGLYRESSFLLHPLVPSSVASNRSTVFRIETEQLRQDTLSKNLSSSRSIHVVGISGNLTADDVIKWFGDVTEKILVFDSLPVSFSTFGGNEKKLKDFEERTRRGFIRSQYRQMTT